MPSRHRSRERALQVLYLRDMRNVSVDDSLDAFYGSLAVDDNEEALPPDDFTDALVRGAAGTQDEIDRHILAHSVNWRLERMAVVDRNILRLATYELRFTDTPTAVVLDEAVNLARRFGDDPSPAFVNGILDAIAQDVRPSAP